MRIISDFHDYYDTVQATGQDQTLIYFRKPEELELAVYPFPILSYWEHLWEPYGPRLRQHIVGFCGKIVYNARLKDLEFFRLFDTYTAFQEITMYLGGLAVPLKEIPEVPDKVMVGVKGFDRWSFRKPPAERNK